MKANDLPKPVLRMGYPECQLRGLFNPPDLQRFWKWMTKRKAETASAPHVIDAGSNTQIMEKVVYPDDLRAFLNVRG